MGSSWYTELLEWFRSHGRRFPWRETRDWYRCLVAEFMLIRTRAETVEKVYREFLEAFPNPQMLCSAEEEKIWSFFKRIGLVNRAQRIRETVCRILELYGGKLPCRYEDLVELPGIGDYIARILLTRVCRIPTPFVDTNVYRVITRFLGLDLDREAIARWLEREVPKEHLEDVNIALLDLAALVCKSRNPRCSLCPLASRCSYAKNRSRTP